MKFVSVYTEQNYNGIERGPEATEEDLLVGFENKSKWNLHLKISLEQ